MTSASLTTESCAAAALEATYIEGMSANNQPNRVPKGVPTGGEFAESTRQEMSSADLGGFFAAAETDAEAAETYSQSKLTEACSHFKLADGDLPGLDEAWQTKFGELDDADPVSPEPNFTASHDTAQVVQHLSGEYFPKETEADLVHEKVDGDGRDLWMYQATDHGGPVIELDEETWHRAKAFEKWSSTIHRRDHLERQAESFASGETPIWHLMADQNELRAAEDDVQQATREVNALQAITAAARSRRDDALGALKGVETGDFSDCPDTVLYKDGSGQRQAIDREEFEALIAYTNGLTARGRDAYAEAAADAGRPVSASLRAERAANDADTDVKRRREIVGYLEYAETSEQITIDEADRAPSRLDAAHQRWLQVGWDGPLPELAD